MGDGWGGFISLTYRFLILEVFLAGVLFPMVFGWRIFSGSCSHSTLVMEGCNDSPNRHFAARALLLRLSSYSSLRTDEGPSHGIVNSLTVPRTKVSSYLSVTRPPTASNALGDLPVPKSSYGVRQFGTIHPSLFNLGTINESVSQNEGHRIRNDFYIRIPSAYRSMAQNTSVSSSFGCN